MPALANEIAESINLYDSSLEACHRGSGRYFLSLGSTGDQTHCQTKSLHRTSMEVGLRLLPLRFDDGRTHFGNITTIAKPLLSHHSEQISGKLIEYVQRLKGIKRKVG